jgi:hypothetical protein
VTVRKLEFETDAYAFADKALAAWYGEGDAAVDKKGVVLMVTAGKEGAVVGGKGFLAAVGEDLADSVAADNIPIFAEEEKFNAAVTTSVDRIEAALNGTPVPGAFQEWFFPGGGCLWCFFSMQSLVCAVNLKRDKHNTLPPPNINQKQHPNTNTDAPKRNDFVRQRTYKTKEETEKSKTVTSTVVLTLLFIACVVPMLQYYGYTSRCARGCGRCVHDLGGVLVVAGRVYGLCPRACKSVPVTNAPRARKAQSSSASLLLTHLEQELSVPLLLRLLFCRRGGAAAAFKGRTRRLAPTPFNPPFFFFFSLSPSCRWGLISHHPQRRLSFFCVKTAAPLRREEHRKKPTPPPFNFV